MASQERSAWSLEVNAYARAFAGAYIFGIPLLFTMEMWWIGEYADRWKLLVFLLVAFLANFGLSLVSGFRRDSTVFGAVEEAVEAVAVGIVAAVVVLLVLNRIRWGDPLDSSASMVLLQAVPLSIGASVANEVFGRPEGRQGRNSGNHLPQHQELLSDIGATAVGGIFVGFSIAPTEEIPMLASGMDYPHLVALIAFSLVISYVIVFASGFDKTRPSGPFQLPLTETTLSYVVSLVVAGMALVLFDQLTFDQPVESIARQMLVLGVPTTVGGAAGRLVV